MIFDETIISEKLTVMKLTNTPGEKVDVAPHHQSFMSNGDIPWAEYLSLSLLHAGEARQMSLQQARQLMQKMPSICDSSVTSSVQLAERRATKRQPLPLKKQQQQQELLEQKKRCQHRMRSEICKLQAQLLLEPRTTTSPSPPPRIAAKNVSAVSSSSSASASSSPSTTPPPLRSPLFGPSVLKSSSILLPHPIVSGATQSASTAADAEGPTTTKDSGATAVAAVIANSKKKYPCDLCDKSFDYKHVLQNHNRTHTGEKPYECPVCQKRFTRDHHLKTHMRLHTGEKPYECGICGKKFVQVANLRRHERVHTGERPYGCDVDECQAKFSDKNQLKSHQLLHSDEKPFGCPKCGYRFRRKHHAKTHKCKTAAIDRHRQRLDTTSDTPSSSVTTVATASSAVFIDTNDNSRLSSSTGMSSTPSPVSSAPSPASAISNGSSNASLASNSNSASANVKIDSLPILDVRHEPGIRGRMRKINSSSCGSSRNSSNNNVYNKNNNNNFPDNNNLRNNYRNDDDEEEEDGKGHSFIGEVNSSGIVADFRSSPPLTYDDPMEVACCASTNGYHSHNHNQARHVTQPHNHQFHPHHHHHHHLRPRYDHCAQQFQRRSCDAVQEQPEDLSIKK